MKHDHQPRTHCHQFGALQVKPVKAEPVTRLPRSKSSSLSGNSASFDTGEAVAGGKSDDPDNPDAACRFCARSTANGATQTTHATNCTNVRKPATPRKAAVVSDLDPTALQS